MMLSCNFLVLVFKHQVVHTDGVTVFDSHLLHAFKDAGLAEDAVKVHAAFIVGKIDRGHQALTQVVS